MRKLFLLAFAALLSFQSFSQQKKHNYPSLLWAISGNGLTKTSYLYGTWHVSEKMAFNLSDTFYIALEHADMVALELNPDSWLGESMEYENAANHTEYVNNFTIPSLFYKRTFNLNIPDQQDLQRFLKSSPDIVNSMLYRTSNMRDDYEQDTYLDLYIFQAGRKLNKKVFGLEDFRQSRELVRQSEICGEETPVDKEKVEQMKLKLQELQGDKSFNELFEEAYRMGDLDLLDSLNILSTTKECAREFMLNRRNVIMANRMDSLMRHNSLFTGVGAAHLPGSKGVIELLRRKGYTVRPVISPDGFNNKMVKKLEELRYPVQFATNYSSDSAFSVMVPGKLSELSDMGASKSYLFNDMANGAYYYIQRVNYFGGLTGENQDNVMVRMDSLLFENIPGKVLSKEIIHTKNGFPGYDIVNKTRRGDVQRYQIIITPEEIYIFKMSGTGEYVKKGKEAEQFFNSISFNLHSRHAERVYSPPTQEYQLKVPSSAIVYRSNNPFSIQKEIITTRQTEGKSSYFFISSSLYDFINLEEDTFELHFLAETFCKQLKYKISSTELAYQGKYPALNVVYSNDSNERIYSRIIIRSHNYYQIGLKTKDKAEADTYLNSFTFLPYAEGGNYATYTDTVLHFSVGTLLNRSAFSGLVRPYPKTASDSYFLFGSEEEKKNKKEEQDFLPVRESRIYVSNETGEKILVEFRKFSMYFQFPTLDKFWDFELNGMTKEASLKASRIKKEEHGDIHEMSFLLTDTNSTRGFLVKMMQKCGSLYTLKTYVDTVDGATPFITHFYQSFSPKDTCIGLNILSDKLGDHFFNKIYSTDTLERKRAQNAIDYVRNNLSNKHASKLMVTLTNPGFSKLEIKEKTKLIIALGTLQSPEILPFLEKMYDTYTDSLRIQIAILTAVAQQKSIPAAKTFLRLLHAELPISKNSSSIAEMFYPFYDSLPVAKALFPGLLSYSKYPDFRSPVYHLLNRCVVKGVIRKKDYSRYRDDILNDARYDFKLYTSGGETKTSGRYYSSYDLSSSVNYSEPLNSITNEQYKIYVYANLLAPFYLKDRDVQKFFRKALVSRPAILRVFIAEALLHNNIPVADSVWGSLAKDANTRYWLYRVLKKENHLDRFDSLKYDQKELALSMLYADNYDPKKDTLVLLEKLQASSGLNHGYVYVFKSRPLDKKIWKMGYIGIMPDGKQGVNINPEVMRRDIAYESEKQKKKELEEVMKKLRIDNRKRASLSDMESGKGYYTGYDDGYPD